jgi:hypothetical protein
MRSGPDSKVSNSRRVEGPQTLATPHAMEMHRRCFRRRPDQTRMQILRLRHPRETAIFPISEATRARDWIVASRRLRI